MLCASNCCGLRCFAKDAKHRNSVQMWQPVKDVATEKRGGGPKKDYCKDEMGMRRTKKMRMKWDEHCTSMYAAL